MDAFDIGRLRMIPVTAMLQWHLDHSGRIDPYLGAGFSYVRTDSLHSADLDSVGVGQVRVKSRIGWTAGAAVLMIGLFVAALLAASTPNTPEQEIDQSREQLFAAYARKDVPAMMALITEDAIWMPPNAPDVRGKTAIEQALRGMTAALTIKGMRVHKREFQVVGDLAYDLSWYTETLEPKDGPQKDVEGRYFMVWKRGDDGKWRLHRDLFSLTTDFHLPSR